MMGFRKLALITLALATPTAACTQLVVESPAAAVGANLTVERFLQAANQRDVVAMGNMFGTESGPVMETGSTFGCAFKKIGSWFGGSSCVTKVEVEIRMDMIASILQHEDYRIVGENRVAGRVAPTRRVSVDIRTDQGPVSAVPFDVVLSDGRWLIQEVDLQRVMAAR